MKTDLIKKTFLYVLAAGFILTSCTDIEPIDFEEKINDFETTKTDEYYAALREWKQTPGLPQTYVWFDGWTGISPTGANSLRGLPDSVTIASNWGGHPKFNLSEARKADMEYVQRVKGTKVVVTLFSANVGDDMPHDPIYDACRVDNTSDEALIRPAIRKYVEAIYDAVVESGYDGYDWDFEPYYGGDPRAYLWRNRTQAKIFVEELTYWFGKGATDPNRDRGGRKPAKPGLLLIIDGEVGIGDRLGRNWLSYYVDYFILQAYGGGNLSGRVNGVIGDLSDWIADETIDIDTEEVIRRTILTENFESYAVTGGGILNMARYIHRVGDIEQQIGGFGMYRPGFDYAQGKGDYNGSPEWWFLRHGITEIYRIFYERQNPPEESE